MAHYTRKIFAYSLVFLLLLLLRYAHVGHDGYLRSLDKIVSYTSRRFNGTPSKTSTIMLKWAAMVDEPQMIFEWHVLYSRQSFLYSVFVVSKKQNSNCAECKMQKCSCNLNILFDKRCFSLPCNLRWCCVHQAPISFQEQEDQWLVYSRSHFDSCHTFSYLFKIEFEFCVD